MESRKAKKSQPSFVDDQSIGLKLFRFTAGNQLETLLQQMLEKPKHLGTAHRMFGLGLDIVFFRQHGEG